MRKTKKNPDGSEEILEGDPEELKKYEDLQRSQQDQAPITESPQKPGILHGAEVDGKPLSEEEVEWIRWIRRIDLTPKTSSPIGIVSCRWCGRIDRHSLCWQGHASGLGWSVRCNGIHFDTLLGNENPLLYAG